MNYTPDEDDVIRQHYTAKGSRYIHALLPHRSRRSIVNRAKKLHLECVREQGVAPAGWLNPNYSDITPWMQKVVEQAKRGFTTVMLCPADNGEDRYGDFVHGVASEYRTITGRIAFLNADGRPVSGNTRGSALIVYRGFDLGDTRYGGLMRDAMQQEMREAA